MIGMLEQMLAMMEARRQAQEASRQDLYGAVPSTITAQPPGQGPTPFRPPMQGGPEPPTREQLSMMMQRMR